MNRYIVLTLVLALAACEDTRRASRHDGYAESGRTYGDLYASRGAVKTQDDLLRKLQDQQAKLDSLQNSLTTGAWDCDELARLTRCMYDKSSGYITADAIKAFDDSVKLWKDALDNPATRQATIDACKMSLDAGRQGYSSMGCY